MNTRQIIQAAEREINNRNKNIPKVSLTVENIPTLGSPRYSRIDTRMSGVIDNLANAITVAKTMAMRN